MKKLAILLTPIVSFLPHFANAAPTPKNYDLKIELSVNGKKITTPELNVKEGETTSVVQETDGEKTYMDVSATEKPTVNDTAVQVKFVVGKIGADGEKTILSTPKLITLENQKAELTVVNGQGGEDLKISVIANKKTE